MREYGKEQGYQLSRAIANNESGNKQLKKFVDNRMAVYHHNDQLAQMRFIRNNTIQRTKYKVAEDYDTAHIIINENDFNAARSNSFTYLSDSISIRQGIQEHQSSFVPKTIGVNSTKFAVCGGYGAIHNFIVTNKWNTLLNKNYVAADVPASDHVEKTLLDKCGDNILGVSTAVCQDRCIPMIMNGYDDRKPIYTHDTTGFKVYGKNGKYPVGDTAFKTVERDNLCTRVDLYGESSLTELEQIIYNDFT